MPPIPAARFPRRLVVLHWLTVLLLAMPVIGYLLLNAEGHAPSIAGLQLPLLVAENHALAERLEGWHEGIAVAGYWLVGLHAMAALYHLHVRHDDTLLRMSFRR